MYQYRKTFYQYREACKGGGYISRVTVYKVVILCILNLLPPMDIVTTIYFKFPSTL